MLVVGRKNQQEVRCAVNNADGTAVDVEIVVRVLSIRGNYVRLGLEAPKDRVDIFRGELGEALIEQLAGVELEVIAPTAA